MVSTLTKFFTATCVQFAYGTKLNLVPTGNHMHHLLGSCAVQIYVESFYWGVAVVIERLLLAYMVK